VDCIEEDATGEDEYVATRLVIDVADEDCVPIKEPVCKGDPEITGVTVVCWETVEETVELGDGVNPGDAEGHCVIDTVEDLEWTVLNERIGLNECVMEEEADGVAET